jgi:uncharacterized protein (TIGR02118 family)
MAYTLVYQVFRKVGTTRAEFAAYWDEVHAPIAAKLPGLLTYQNYAVTSAIDAHDPVPDGFTVLAFESKAAAEAAMCSPEMAASSTDSANYTAGHAMFVVDHLPVI